MIERLFVAAWLFLFELVALRARVINVHVCSKLLVSNVNTHSHAHTYCFRFGCVGGASGSAGASDAGGGGGGHDKNNGTKHPPTLPTPNYTAARGNYPINKRYPKSERTTGRPLQLSQIFQ